MFERPSIFRRLVVLTILVALPVLPGSSASTPAGGMQDPIRRAMAEGRFAEARTMLEGEADGRAEGERLELLTAVCNALGDHEAGTRFGKQAIGKSPESANAHFQYAVAVRTKMQNVSKMKAMFSVGTYKKALAKARELDPKNLDAREEEIGYLTQAPGIAGGDVGRARELAAELKELDLGRGLGMEVEIELQKGDPARAETLFHEALAVNPDNLGLRTRFAYHLQSQKKYNEADAEFEKLQASARPRVARGALYQRARTRVLGRYEQDQAVRFLQQYVEEATEQGSRLPSRSSAYWRMGNAYEQLKQIAKAREAYSKAIELDPENSAAKKALKALPR